MGAVWLVIAYVVFIVIFAVGVCWLWPDYVDCTEPPRIRRALLLIWMSEGLVEVVLWGVGILKPWTLLAIFICNTWGQLDAFLRFPIVYDLDSLFTVKQACLVIIKLMSYALGFQNIGKQVGWFVLVVLCCVFLVPILWLTALPIGDVHSYHQKHDVVDMDLVLRLYYVLRKPSERALLLARGRALARRAMVAALQYCPFLEKPLIHLDPSLERSSQRERRSV